MLCIQTCQTLLVSASLIFSTMTHPMINSTDMVTFYQFSKPLIPESFCYYLEKGKYISGILSFALEF